MRWKSALSAIFATNCIGESRQYGMIYSQEVGKKACTHATARIIHSLFNNIENRPFGDVESLSIRRRILGIVYDNLTSITNLVDQTSWFMEMASYLRDVPLQTLLWFLDPPKLMRSSRTDYVAGLCEALLRPLVVYKRLPKNWIYNYKNGQEYITIFLVLAPKTTKDADNVTMAEAAVKVAAIVEVLLRIWAKVRKTATVVRQRTMSGLITSTPTQTQILDNFSDQSETENAANSYSSLLDAANEGITARRVIVDDAQIFANTEDSEKWERMKALLKGSEVRLMTLVKSLKE